MSVPSREHLIEGCILGGAIGDAIGSHFEDRPIVEKFTFPVTLRITDDTQLTLATCESIIESQSVVPELIADRFAAWFRDRRLRGLGASTYKALSELVAGGHWALVGATGERSAGSGAAMRIAPLAFLLDPDQAADRQVFRDICRITHRNEEAYAGGIAMLRSIRHVASGNPCSNELLTMLIDLIPDSGVRDRLIEVRSSSISVDEYASRFSTSGYVVDAVPFAILTAIESSTFIDTVRRIALSGGDTDTIASMFGNIYGAAHGVDALPKEIANRIDAVKVVQETARLFSTFVVSR